MGTNPFKEMQQRDLERQRVAEATSKKIISEEQVNANNSTSEKESPSPQVKVTGETTGQNKTP